MEFNLGSVATSVLYTEGEGLSGSSVCPQGPASAQGLANSESTGTPPSKFLHPDAVSGSCPRKDRPSSSDE